MPALSQSLLFTLNTAVGNTGTVAIVYPNTATTWLTYISSEAKGDGYYNGGDGYHTVQYVATGDFVGTMTMQATLATEPIESDWFSVKDVTVSYGQLDIETDNRVDVRTFIGNFVWVRGKVDIHNGSVLEIQYNH